MKSPWSVSRMGENRTSGLMSGGVETGPLKDTAPPLDSTKSSTALRNVGTGATLVGFATLQGVDPASPANQLDAPTSTRPSFARYEFCEISGLRRIAGCLLVSMLAASAKVPEMPTMPEGVEQPSNFQELIELYQSHGVEVYFPKIELEQGVTRLLDIPFVTRGEQELKLDLFLPYKPYLNSPLVILVYGGGFRMGDKKNEHPKAHWLVNRGYAVACLQYRLSGVASFPAPLNDLKAAVSLLRQNASEYGYDPERIAMFGGSAGAHLTSLVASTADKEEFERSGISNAIQAAIVVGAPPDMTSPYGIAESRKAGSDYRMFLGVSYDDHPEVVEQASTNHHLSANTPPSLLIDEHFNPSSAPVRDKLAEWGITHDYMVLSGGIHGEWLLEPWFTITLDRTDKFLKTVFEPKN